MSTVIQDVNSYIAQISSNPLAKPNRYWAEFYLPSGVNSSGWNVDPNAQNGIISSVQSEINSSGEMSARCNIASMPGRGVATVEHRHGSIPHKMPYVGQYDDIQFTFILSEDLRERRYFETWMGAVINVSDGTLNFYNEYTSKVNVHQLDINGNIMYTVELREAYPIAIGPVEYSYAQQNEIQQFSVTMTYKYWKRTTDEF